MTGKIFINYRRGDDPGHTGRLFDRLQDVFEPGQLFLDVDNIAPGLDFVRVLNERVAECDVVLAVIGKSWIDARDTTGARRLDDPDDFVRIEIVSALNQDKRVIPVLVGEAQMPRADELPDALRPLARRNAVRLTHERFRADVQGLVKALQQALAEIEQQQHRQAQAEAARRADEERRRQEAEAARRAEEEERKRLAEIEAQRRAADEVRRQETEAAQHAEEERHHREAEAARRVEEEERQKLAEIEARQRAAEERRRKDAEAKKRGDEERAFAAAKRAGTVAAINAFLAANAASYLAEEAQKLRAALLAREDAHRHAMASDDTTVLKAFCDSYQRGADVDQARARLRQIVPAPPRQLPRPIIMVPAALALAIAAGLVVWVTNRSAPDTRQATTAAAPPVARAVKPPEAEARAKIGSTVPATATALAPERSLPAATKSAPVSAAPPRPDELAWSLLKDTTDDDALKRFIAQFPGSPLRQEAETRVADLAAAQAAKPAGPPPDQIAWGLVKDSNDTDELQRFIAQFPNSAQRTAAEQRIASLTTAKAAAAAPPDAHELARSLQFELQRVGCFGGTVNGEFDDATKTAWHKFIKLTSISMPDAASADAINAVRGINKRICPLVCPHGEHAESEQCVANPPPPAKHTTAQAAPSPQPTQRAAPPAGMMDLPCRNPRFHHLPGGGCGY